MRYKKIREFLIDTKFLWKRYLLTSIASALMILAGLFLPICVQKIIDEGVYSRNYNQVIIYIIMYIVISLIQTGSMHIVNIQYAIISKMYCIETKKKIFNTIKKFNGYDIQKEKSGKIIHTIEEDIEDISVTVTDKVFQIISDLFTALFSFLILFSISPLILISVLILQILLLIVNKKLSVKINTLNKENFELRDIQGSSLQEFMINLDYIIGSNLVDFFSNKYIEKEDKTTNIACEIQKTMSLNFCYQNILNTIMKCIIWSGGGLLVILDKITIGKLFVIDLYSGKLAAPIYRIVDNNLELKKLILEIERVYSLINKSFEEEKRKNINLNGKVISFQNVQFSYDDKKDILHNINLQIYPNEVNVFIGKSGQGKSTLIKLLIGMWKVDNGNILIGNSDLYEYSRKGIRDQIGMVSQDIPIFNTTILENLVLTNNYSMDEIIQACELTGIYEEIMCMKEQFNTVISEYGRNLSGGQKQRIAITRAILKKAEVIILDEPTSNLDQENKEQIKNLIYGLRGKTVILITHDKELVETEKNVYLLNNGQIKFKQ